MERRNPSDDHLTSDANAELLARIDSQFGDEREKDNPLYEWLQNKERPVTDELVESLPPAVQEMIRFLEVHDGTEQDSELPESVQEAGRHTSVYIGANANLTEAKRQFTSRPKFRPYQRLIFDDHAAFHYATKSLETAMSEMQYMKAGELGLLNDDALKGYMVTAYQVAAEVVRAQAAEVQKTPVIVENPFSDTKFMHEVAGQLIQKDRAQPRYQGS